MGNWEELLDAINDQTDITLKCDIPRIPDDSENPDGSDDPDGPDPLTIPEGKERTINLNGWTLDTDGTVITVSEGAKLTIKNGPDASQAGTITNGGGIRVEANGELTIQDKVKITGNTAPNGGGIYVEKDGTVTIEENANVEITGNTATGDGTTGDIGLGGGVYNAGTFTMEGGAIYGNSAGEAAADFYNAPGGKFTLVEAGRYIWYQDGPDQEQRYLGKLSETALSENELEGTGVRYLAAEVPLTVEGNQEGNPYLIYDEVELAAFRDIVNGSNGEGAGNPAADAKLMKDITIYGDLETLLDKNGNPKDDDLVSWEPIGLGDSGAYTGTFDGNGKTISNLYCNRSNSAGGAVAGLFSAIDTKGKVQDLNVEDSSVSAGGEGDSIGGDTADDPGPGSAGNNGGTAGGICATNSGTITGCTVSDSVSVSASTAGGVCGTNQGGGTIENCRNDGSVTANGTYSSTAGGVCGYNTGTVTNCLNTGTVTMDGSGSLHYAGGICGDNGSNDGAVGTTFGTVTNCLNTGTVTATTTGDQEPKIGGVCGNNIATVTNCYYREDTCEEGIGSGTGDATDKTSAELESGAVAYLLNGTAAGTETAPWRQNLDNGTTKDPFPVPDDDHGVVYQKEGGGYTNTPPAVAEQPSSGGSHRPARDDGPSTGHSDGWKDIRDELGDAEDGDTITIDMGDETEVPGEIFEEVAGKDVTVEFELEDGVSWTVNGQDIPTDTGLSDLDLGVSMDSRGIPVNVFNAITGEYSTVQFTLSHDGPFGFTLTLAAPLGRDNAGYWANLYYYHEKGRELEFQQAARIGRDGRAEFRMDHASQYAVVIDDKSHEPEPLPFSDVPEDHWAYDAIQYVYGEGLMAGTGEATFSPSGTTTRGQIVTILWRLAGSPQVDYLMDFADVAPAAWYGEAVRWASALRIASGYGDGRFGPDDPITREQLAVMLYQYAWNMGYDLTGGGMALREYGDYDRISGWALEALDWAVNAGIISGTGDSALSPQGRATRAQTAVMLQKFCELDK